MLIRMSLQVQTHEMHAFMREEFMYVYYYSVAQFKLDIRTFVLVQLLKKFITELASFLQAHDQWLGFNGYDKPYSHVVHSGEV